MDRVWLDNLKLHDISDATLKRMLVFPLDGLEFPSLRVGSFANASQDGVTVVSNYTGERRITLNGNVTASSASEFDSQRQELLKEMAPVRDVNEFPKERVLKFETGGKTYRLACQVLGIDMPRSFVSHAKFQIDILAQDTYLRGDTLFSETVSIYQPGGFAVPFVLPVTFSGGTGGTLDITNEGDAPVYPVLTLNGQLTNPRIENTTTGKFMALTHTVGSLETVTIDMEERTIMQENTNLINTKSNDSRFWKLEPGQNTIKLTTGIAGESGNVDVSYRNAYVGI